MNGRFLWAREERESRRTVKGLGAVILAAGAGRRMGFMPKCLLERDGEPLIIRTLRLMVDAGASGVALVLGHHAERIEKSINSILGRAWTNVGIRVLVNPNPESGPAESLKLGLGALSRFDHYLVMASDLPLVENADVRFVLDIYRNRRAGIDVIWPEHNGILGHPVVCSSRVADDLKRQKSAGLRAWCREHPHRVMMPGCSSRCTEDVDTHQDCMRLRAAHGVVLEWPEDLPA